MFKSYDEMLEELEREMRRVSDDVLLQMFRISTTSGEVWSPRVDVYETAEAVVVKVCAAGLDSNQMELTISGDNRFMTLRGVRVEADEDKSSRIRYHQLEIYYGPFERIIPLPADVPVDRDKLAAAYKDGFLKVVFPKAEKKRISKKIDIKE
ncbi:MAG: Hsp20/alpha crystallin family protein [Armatimonadetes bacterium]|nr:Hsp20/alpha crystallin family protein [Armatimonadota bacterium]